MIFIAMAIVIGLGMFKLFDAGFDFWAYRSQTEARERANGKRCLWDNHHKRFRHQLWNGKKWVE